MATVELSNQEIVLVASSLDEKADELLSRAERMRRWATENRTPRFVRECKSGADLDVRRASVLKGIRSKLLRAE